MNLRELTREEKDILYTKIAMLPEMDPIDILNAIEKRSQIKDEFKQTIMSAISKALFNNMVWDDEYLASLDIQEHDYKIFEKNGILKIYDTFPYIADLLNDVNKWAALCADLDTALTGLKKFSTQTELLSPLDFSIMCSLHHIVPMLPKHQRMLFTIDSTQTQKINNCHFIENTEMVAVDFSGVARIRMIKPTIGGIYEFSMTVTINASLAKTDYGQKIIDNSPIKITDFTSSSTTSGQCVHRLDMLYILYRIYDHFDIPVIANDLINTNNRSFLYNQLDIVWFQYVDNI